MTQTQILEVMQKAISTMLTVSLPVLGIGMLVGIIVSIFQATTQINEQTLSFVPKIIAIMLALMIMGGWMLTTLNEFFIQMFEYINTMIG